MASTAGSAPSRRTTVGGWLARWATSPPTLHSGRALGWCHAAATSSRDTIEMTWSVAARNAGRRSGSGRVALRWCGVVAGGLEAGPVGLLGPQLLALGAVRAEVAPGADRRGARGEAGRLDTDLLELGVGTAQVRGDGLGLGDLARERLVGLLVGRDRARRHVVQLDPVAGPAEHAGGRDGIQRERQ